MKKILIFVLILFELLSVKAIAHSPSSMSLNYNKETKELNVTITHIVSDSTNHYIYNITIEKNNQFYRSYEYTNQPTTSSFTYNYSNIEAEDADTFTVVAFCNKGGQKSASLTVGSNIEDKNTPGFEIIIIICMIVSVLFWKKN
jgi:hypothetical protein